MNLLYNHYTQITRKLIIEKQWNTSNCDNEEPIYMNRIPKIEGCKRQFTLL